MTFNSVLYEGGFVSFPEFRGEKHYMIPFFQKKGLPSNLSHWQRTVDQMLDGIQTDEPIYFMADQQPVKQAETHRRSGLHVDGYWHPALNAHGGHRGVHTPVRRHRGGGHFPSHCAGASSWAHADFSEPEALLLASNGVGCRGYRGAFEGPIGEGGDCSGVDTSNMTSHTMIGRRTYIGNVGTLHESVPSMYSFNRTLVRLNCPGVTVQ